LKSNRNKLNRAKRHPLKGGKPTSGRRGDVTHTHTDKPR